jgi:hypothetical protein
MAEGDPFYLALHWPQCGYRSLCDLILRTGTNHLLNRYLAENKAYFQLDTTKLKHSWRHSRSIYFLASCRITGISYS